jgi:hypothetical protein
MDGIVLVIILLAVVLSVAMFLAADNVGRHRLEGWARTHQYDIVSAERRLFFRGPFHFLRTAKGTEVYAITARDARGTVRSGYARCGGWIGGVWFNDSVTVEWDD